MSLFLTDSLGSVSNYSKSLSKIYYLENNKEFNLVHINELIGYV